MGLFGRKKAGPEQHTPVPAPVPGGGPAAGGVPAAETPRSPSPAERTQPLPGRAGPGAAPMREEPLSLDHSGFGPAPVLDGGLVPVAAGAPALAGPATRPAPPGEDERPEGSGLPGAAAPAAVAAATPSRDSWFAPGPVEATGEAAASPIEPPPARQDGFEHPRPARSIIHRVLLSAPDFDWPGMARRLADEWEIEEEPVVAAGVCTYALQGMHASVELMPAPYDRSETEAAARGNRTWREAVHAASVQAAHLEVRVDEVSDPVLGHCLLSILTAAALGDERALAAYVPAAHRLSDPAAYIDTTSRLRAGGRPVENWVAVVATKAEGKGSRGWTRGLVELGHAEVEVLRSHRDLPTLFSAIGRVAEYVADGHQLFPGDTVSGPDGEPMTVTASESVVHDGLTLKLGL